MKPQVPYKPSQKPVFSSLSPLAQQFLDSQSRIESKLDELLSYLKGTPITEHDQLTLQEAIIAHINGDRGPIDQYIKKQKTERIADS